MPDENTAHTLVDDLLTDPDKDASAKPLPPQTSEAEPTSDRPGQHRVADDDED